MSRETEMQTLLAAWYDRRRRDLPWRRTRDPYRIWVAEVMLQQTRVETVVPYYRRFIECFPTVEALARASLEEVLKGWENLGYYARARNLHAAARALLQRGDRPQVPRGHAELLALPGVGAYTAGAILSLAFGQPYPAVDGNARRVISRLYALQGPAGQTEKRIQALAAALVPQQDPGRHNQAVMELGATVCTARRPGCGGCPLQELCEGRRQGLQQRIPAVRRRGPLPHRDVTAAVIRRSDKTLLLIRRPAEGLLGGLWKFPGGERQAGESLAAALRRSLREELGVAARVGRALASVDHAFTHFRVSLHAFRCSLPAGETGLPAGCWIGEGQVAGLPLSRGERKLMAAIGVGAEK